MGIGDFFSKLGGQITQNLHDASRAVGSFYNHNQNTVGYVLQGVSAVPVVGIAAQGAEVGLGIRNEVVANSQIDQENAAIAAQNAQAQIDADNAAEAEANANAIPSPNPVIPVAPSPVVTPATGDGVTSLMTGDTYLFVLGFTALFLLIIITRKSDSNG